MEVNRANQTKNILHNIISESGGDYAYMHDPQYQSEVYRVIDTLVMVDRAMEDAGVNEKTRDKILNICFNNIAKKSLENSKLHLTLSKLPRSFINI